ncbi:histidine phosphatase family protein [Egicoccus sp. AB-alg6-2]|uniref:SixA phosphatase family protein n=1 Tax=Egicoccus sp. AB-alg6-2 TaxID=3242692 RepID=UPI00359EAA26
MPLLLLRHVDAGERGDYTGDDRRRPVSERGSRQAAALIDAYAGLPVERVLSSPYTRCVDSVSPLAAARGLDVEEEEALAEGTPLDVVHGLLRRLEGRDVVLCSHGDVIGALVQDLQVRGVDVDGAGGPRWQKGSTWVLEGDLRTPAVRYLPPPA